MSYNKDTDYQAKINEAVKSGDYESAAQYEQSRNEKIDSEGLDYEKTNRFSGWLDTTDYSDILKNQMSAGASKSAVSDTLKKRIRKSSGTEGLVQYTYDDVYDAAIKYIMGENDFSYNVKEPVYKPVYDNEIRSLYNNLSKMKSFSYDPHSDDVYKYYKEQYNREGQRAMEDLLGELSANTGGIASSYAVSAAAQSLDYYNRKLTDKIPELYQDAYERYLDSVGIKYDEIELLSQLAGDDYNRYLDSLKQYNSDREFSYNAYIDSVENEFDKTQAEREYELSSQELQSKWAQQEYENNWQEEESARKWEQQEYENNWQEEESARKWEQQEYENNWQEEESKRKWAQQEYENDYTSQQDAILNALAKWKARGILDSESAAILGIPAGTHTADYDYKQAQQYNLYRR